MHEDLSSKHVGEASRIVLNNFLVVFIGKIVNKDFQPPHWIIFKHVSSAACSKNVSFGVFLRPMMITDENRSL